MNQTVPQDQLVGSGLTQAYLWSAFRRNVVLVVLTTTFFMVVVGALSLTSSEVYECKTSIWVQRSKAIIETSQLAAPEPTQSMLVAFLNSRSLRLKMAKNLGLAKDKAFWGQEEVEEHTDTELLDRLDKMVEVEEVRSRPIVAVTVQAPTPEMAFKIAGEMMKLAIARGDQMKDTERRFFDEKVKERKRSFFKAVDDLMTFQKEHGLVTDMSAQGQAYYESSLRLKEGLIKTESELAAVNDMLNAPAGIEEQLQLLARKDSLDGAVRYLREQDDLAANTLTSMPDIGAKYIRLQAEVVREQELLKQTVITAEQATLTAEQENPKIILIDAPAMPDKPVNEFVARLILAWAVGGVIGLSLASAREAIRSLRKA